MAMERDLGLHLLRLCFLWRYLLRLYLLWMYLGFRLGDVVRLVEVEVEVVAVDEVKVGEAMVEAVVAVVVMEVEAVEVGVVEEVEEVEVEVEVEVEAGGDVVCLDCSGGLDPTRLQALRLDGRDLGRPLHRRRRRQPARLGGARVRLQLGRRLRGGSALREKVAQQVVPHRGLRRHRRLVRAVDEVALDRAGGLLLGWGHGAQL